MLKTRTIPAVEIFAVGTHNGQQYTEADLDAMVSAFNELRNDGGQGYSPPIKLDHTDKQPQLGDVPADGGPAFGWVDNLRREGEKLVADFMAVPEKLAELIDAGAYRGRSAEVWHNLKLGAKTYSRALKAVALLGVAMPAVRTLADITKLYGEPPALVHDTGRDADVHVAWFADAGKGDDEVTPEDIDTALTAVADKIAASKYKTGAPAIRAALGKLGARIKAHLAGKPMPKEFTADAGDGAGDDDSDTEGGSAMEVTLAQFQALETKVNEFAAANTELTTKVNLLSEANTRLEADNTQLRTFALERWAVETVTKWHGDRDSNRKFLLTTVEKFGQDSDHVRALIAREEANAKALKDAGLFKESGHGVPASLDAKSEFEAAVKVYTDAGKTKAEAITIVAKQRPELYAEHTAAVMTA